MSPRHAALAVAVAALWGLNFVAARLALVHVPPLLLVALRFGIAAIPALVLPRPSVPWPRLIAVASALFIGQFSFLFWGMHVGMPPGLASVLTQGQAIVTVLLATVFLRERPAPRLVVGLALATLGLAVIGTTVGSHGVTAAGLSLTLLAASSWAVGNVLMRRIGPTPMLALVVWLSVVPPLPALALSLLIEGPSLIARSLADLDLVGASAVIYTALVATLGGYAIWGHLLRLYPASAVAPFAMLVPVFGLLSAWLAVGERFGAMRLIGIVVVATGLLIAALPIGALAVHMIERLGGSRETPTRGKTLG